MEDLLTVLDEYKALIGSVVAIIAIVAAFFRNLSKSVDAAKGFFGKFKKEKPKPPATEDSLKKLQSLRDQGILGADGLLRLAEMEQALAHQVMDEVAKAHNLSSQQNQQPSEQNAPTPTEKDLTEFLETATSAQTDAMQLIADGKLQQGLDQLTNATQNAHQDVIAQWRLIGELSYAIDTKRALHAYQTVLVMGSKKSWDFIYTARLYVRIGSLAKAKETLSHSYLQDAALDRRDFMAILIEQGDTANIAGDFPSALGYFNQALQLNQRQVASDPTNTDWQRDLSVSLEKLAGLEQQAGQTDSALKRHQQGLEIMLDLVKTDPTNTEWQRDLSVSLEKVADLEMQAGQTDSALQRYQQSLEIAQDLVNTDPTNTKWQRDLSVSLEKVAGVEEQAGQTDSALKRYRQSLEIAQGLVDTDPANLGYKADMAASYGNIGLLYRQSGDYEAALAAFQAGQDMMLSFAKGTDQVLWQGYMDNFEQNIAVTKNALAESGQDSAE